MTAASEHFGRRLSAAITERGPQAKARSNSKGRARAKSAPSDAVTGLEALPKASGPAAARRKSPAARKRGPVAESRFQALPAHTDNRRQAHALATEEADAVGWPEHWAKAQSTGRQEAVARVAELPEASPNPPLTRRATLLRRLADLVGTKRQT